MKKLFICCALFTAFSVSAQKKPLDHSVYDGWQNISEKLISNDGRFIVYTITPQEGDALLVLQKSSGEKLVEIERGYNAAIAEDNSFVVCKIKPFYQKTRDAKIHKKKAEEMPKDSMAIIHLPTLLVEKHANVSSYKLPDKSAAWLAWQYEEIKTDSVCKKSDGAKKDLVDADNDKPSKDKKGNPAILLLKNMSSGKIDSIKSVTEYLFDRHGTKLVLECAGAKKDSVKSSVIVYSLSHAKADTILSGFNDAKSYAWDTVGKQLAFIAERDSSEKSIQKFYKVYTYKEGDDSAQVQITASTPGMHKGWSVSENANLKFSDSGKRLLFSTAPVLPAKDTSLPEFERVSVDIWNYNDDDLMTVQLKNLEKDLQRSYLAVWDIQTKTMAQLADENFREVKETGQGDGAFFYAQTDTGRRVSMQWQGYVLNDIYAIDATTGKRIMIRKNLKGYMYPSYTGKYLLMYDQVKRSYTMYNSETQKLYPVGADIKTALYDEENDVPDDPGTYGIVKWTENDQYVLINDRYDVWKVDPQAKESSVSLTEGRKNKIIYRFAELDQEEKFIKPEEKAVYRIFDEKDKSTGIAVAPDLQSKPVVITKKPMNFTLYRRTVGNDTTVVVFTKESFTQSPDLNAINFSFAKSKDITVGALTQLSHINPQQQHYSWGTAELFTWKAYTGKHTEGVLYKPDNFDATKKYPMIVYFYERNNTTLNNYIPPAPTPSRLNISYFVSNGYVVFVPDIWYTTGHPGKSAYDYILSGTRALIRQGFVDSARIGLQGQSWGGYQTAFLITQTTLYKAAWAGAPVSNMFSAYGGIRWESGFNRQMQYERQQSRIGATIWEKPQLYMENSPMFHLPKIKTPLVIMANDADGAVPWYQGIELFTDMRRLGKQVWMLNYNNEAHNLLERKNRKDIQIREQQFFDWLLKDKTPPSWITNGVPAIMKGRTLGL
ncbi:prolyl oligopeptidase family serine peptidase [Danxiaibacter flavus]|uniref:Prolyl oligopeptidase family serine peptidase n=1 Tax=Danxiaibacter flavus TaxID=3049108 RepID=A0ABV3ZQ65_9BACT|nr:prolyl oligopeptidase family serine peptidase [Chitinophagaceae bacterium DXS]